MNLVKLFLVAAIPTAALIYGGYMVNEEAMLFACIGALILLSAFYWLSPKVVLKMCGAELLTPYHSPTLFRLVNEVSGQMNLKPPKIFAIHGETPNAFTTGRSTRSACIAFTDGILHSVPEDELRGIIAHELAHIKHHEVLLNSIAAMIAGILGVGLTSKSAEMSVDDEDSRLSKIKRLAVGGYRYSVAPIPSFVIQNLVSMNRVFRADARAAKTTGKPLMLANAIRSMEKKKHQAPLYVSPAVAHLFTVSPLTVGRIARLFTTHPPMEERIQRLETMHKNRVAAEYASNTERGIMRSSAR